MATPAPARASQPQRLGPAHAKLWAAASVSYIGDGIYYTALPLLAATITRDPLRIATVEVAGQLPWLLFALPAGALVDRWDRRRVLWLTDAYRSLVVAALTVAVLAGWASIPLLGAAGLLLAIGSTLFTPASMSIIPSIVSRDQARLERANGRLAAAQTLGEHFLGAPAGGALFSLARPIPLILVLVAQDRLGLGNVGYGLLWTGVAAGSLLGSGLATRLSRRLGPGRVLIASAAAFGATTLGIGATTSPWVAGALLGALGLALTVWNVVVVSLRQAIVPDRLVGRINSTFQLLSMGMLPLGAALGGILGRTLGLRAPFFVTGAALLLMALLAVPVVTTRAIKAARAAA